MKIWFAIGVIWWVVPLYAQLPTSLPTNGVYLTLDDYLHHRLTHPFMNKTKGFHVRLPKMNRLKLITPDSTYTYKLTEIFGYREEGYDWCYREHQLVEIVSYYALSPSSTDGLWLYRRHDWGEGSTNFTYFFSKNHLDTLRWLSKKKIKEAYKNDFDFLNLLQKVRWKRILDTSTTTHKPLLIDIYATAHQTPLPHSY